MGPPGARVRVPGPRGAALKPPQTAPLDALPTHPTTTRLSPRPPSIPTHRRQSDPRVSQAHPPVISGFCYGGGAALRFAATHPGEVSAVAVFYGSPIADMGGLEGPVLGVYGTADTQFPAAAVDKFEQDLRAASISARILRFKAR